MVLLAFSLQDQVEKYGAYVGIAAFFGLAVLSLLYFAQAREVKRLREWAGRAPELGSELEDAIRDFDDHVRRLPVAAPVQPRPVALPEPVVANGAVKLKPEEVAALAFARAAGVHQPHEPKHQQPVPAAAAAVAATPAQVVKPAPAPAPVAAPTNGGGGAVPPPPVPAPATPAARRLEPLPPRRPTPAARRPAPPARRESNTRAVVATAVIGVLVLAGAAFGASQMIGGDDTPAPPNRVENSTPEDEEAAATATPAPTPTKENALVAVYNGTGATGLAATYADQLVDEGYPRDNLGVDNAPPEQQRDTSVVMYKRGSRGVASEVATALDIRTVQQFDDPIKAVIANSGKDWNVVVIVGADKGQ